MGRLKGWLSSFERRLLELSLTEIIPTPSYDRISIVIALIVGVLFSVSFPLTKWWIEIIMGTFLTYFVIRALRCHIESLYTGKVVFEWIRSIEGKHPAFLRAYLELATDKLRVWGEHFDSMTKEEGCQFREGTRGIGLNEQLSVIQACIEISLESDTRGVSIYHLWNNDIFPIRETWKETSVAEYVDKLVDSYRIIEKKVRVFVVDDIGFENLMDDPNSEWSEIEEYHRVNSIKGVRWNVDEFNRMRKIPESYTKYVDGTLIRSRRRSFALAIVESGRARFVRFLSGGKELDALVALFNESEKYPDIFGS